MEQEDRTVGQCDDPGGACYWPTGSVSRLGGLVLVALCTVGGGVKVLKC